MSIDPNETPASLKHTALAQFLSQTATSLDQVVGDASDYFRYRQVEDGSIGDDPETRLFHTWDTVNVFRSLALWRVGRRFEDRRTVDSMLAYLSTQEQPGGALLFSGLAEPRPRGYCAETTSEYVLSLVQWDLLERAHAPAQFLRDRQLPTGEWEVGDCRIPKHFQIAPSVTAYILLALRAVGHEPKHLDWALESLLACQKPEGHFGVNRFYYNTPLYLLRPVVMALSSYGYHVAAAAARDFLLRAQRADGSWPAVADDIASAISAELQTALALETLAHTGLTAADGPVRRGLSWLLGRRRADGSWCGGHYPYPTRAGYPNVRVPQDVYTTAQVLSALKKLAVAEAC